MGKSATRLTTPPQAEAGGLCGCGRHALSGEMIDVCLPCRRAFVDGTWLAADVVIRAHPSWPVEFLNRVCPQCASRGTRGRRQLRRRPSGH